MDHMDNMDNMDKVDSIEADNMGNRSRSSTMSMVSMLSTVHEIQPLTTNRRQLNHKPRSAWTIGFGIDFSVMFGNYPRDDCQT